MPKVVRFHQLGGPEVLKFEDQASREPKAREVRIRVQAVGLNRAEALYARGQYLEQPRLPSGLGYEAAGIIEAVGPDVDRTWIGHKVATVPGFSLNDYPVLGEEAVVPVANIAPYPEKLTPTEAAAMWMQYLTAWGGLVNLGRITKDDFIVISAASSSVGVAAIQIAKEQGAIAIAIACLDAGKVDGDIELRSSQLCLVVTDGGRPFVEMAIKSAALEAAAEAERAA